MSPYLFDLAEALIKERRREAEQARLLAAISPPPRWSWKSRKAEPLDHPC